MLAAPARYMARPAHCGAAHATLARAHLAALHAPLTQPQQGGFFAKSRVVAYPHTAYIFLLSKKAGQITWPGSKNGCDPPINTVTAGDGVLLSNSRL